MYRALLHLYPASWQAEYATEMCAVFDRRRLLATNFVALALLWVDALADLLWNSAAVHLDLFRQDVRYAMRAFRRTPGFAITAVGIAALGIGATTAAFTMV